MGKKKGRYEQTPSTGRYLGDGVIDGANPRMRIVTINVPERYCLLIEKFIEWGEVPSRSEYIRNATAEKIERDLKFIEKVDSVIEAPDSSKIRIPNGDGTYATYKILARLE